jgi:nucleotide-binding universal stress UspA family protein
MASVGEIVLPDVLDETLPAAKIYLENVAKDSSLVNVCTETQAVIGHPAEAIMAAVKADNTDLVVMCSHGYTGEMRWSMGSIAEKVARHVSSPIFILYEYSTLLNESADFSRRPLRILVPLDGSQHAEAVLPKAATLATTLAAPAHGELHLTRVVPSRGKEKSSLDEELERTGHYLRTVIKHMRRHVLSAVGASPEVALSWSITMAEDAASGIIQAAEEGKRRGDDAGCQVIAMTAHGQGGLQLWSLGNTTERVLQAARKPLFIVH